MASISFFIINIELITNCHSPDSSFVAVSENSDLFLSRAKETPFPESFASQKECSFCEGHVKGSLFSCSAFVLVLLGVAHFLFEFPGSLGKHFACEWRRGNAPRQRSCSSYPDACILFSAPVCQSAPESPQSCKLTWGGHHYDLLILYGNGSQPS